jgi:hypothetical protein
MECSKLLHSKVMECFIKENFGYGFLREVVANRTPRLDCRMAKWNVTGNFSYHEQLFIGAEWEHTR